MIDKQTVLIYNQFIKKAVQRYENATQEKLGRKT